MATAIAGWSGRHTPTTVGLDTTTTGIGIGELRRPYRKAVAAKITLSRPAIAA